LVVNDGSTDKTEAILQGLLSEHCGDLYRIATHAINKGYGAALKTGVRFAIDNNYEYVVFMDSDLTNHPKYLKDFYEKMLEGYDYIKASRYCPGGGMSGVSWQRRLISFWGNKVARLMFAPRAVSVADAAATGQAAAAQLTQEQISNIFFRERLLMALHKGGGKATLLYNPSSGAIIPTPGILYGNELLGASVGSSGYKDLVRMEIAVHYFEPGMPIASTLTKGFRSMELEMAPIDKLLWDRLNNAGFGVSRDLGYTRTVQGLSDVVKEGGRLAVIRETVVDPFFISR